MDGVAGLSRLNGARPATAWSRGRAVAFCLSAILVVVTFVIGITQLQSKPTISDSIAYLQASRQLALGKGLAYVDPHNRVEARYYTLYGFKVVHPLDANRSLDYPPGLPLLGATLIAASGNPDAALLTVPLAAAVLVAATSVIGTLLFSPWAGFWAALALLLTRTFFEFATALWSDVPAAALLYCGLGLYLACPHRHGARLAVGVLAGLLVGASCFVRFSNVAILAAAALPAVLAIKRHGALRHYAWSYLLGIFVCIFSLAVFNAFYYGGPIDTAYSPIHGWYAQPAFALDYAFGKSFVGGWSVPALGSTLVADYGLLLMFLIPVVFVRPGAPVGVLGLIVISALAPYTVYAFAAEGINSRFVLTAWPALCLLIGGGIHIVLSGPRGIWRPGLVGLFVFSMLLRQPAQLAALQQRNEDSRQSIEQAQQLAALTEPNAVFMSYVYNDMLAMYAQRSVLNYRHMVPYDPLSGSYQYSRFEDALVQEVNGLLAAATPTYYLDDTHPPLYDSYAILSRHFTLSAMKGNEALYRVGLK